MKKYKKFAIIFLVAGFGILTGFYLKQLIELDFRFEDNYKPLIKMIIAFCLMSVMFFEWMKILKFEKKS